ncbi:hypothetical protein [Xanthomonas campestris]|uniref:hypothetical protein n=1 Tax=Xanthomonas campestris TaxID=339 RepID=UPI003CCF4C89
MTDVLAKIAADWPASGWDETGRHCQISQASSCIIRSLSRHDYPAGGTGHADQRLNIGDYGKAHLWAQMLSRCPCDPKNRSGGRRQTCLTPSWRQ